MAERRMFAKTITNSDSFLEMPSSAQNLYFHLSMNADDDGFINKPKAIMRMVGSHEDDLRVLIAKAFIIPFDSGVVVIKHWRINNYIRGDRKHPTEYKEEFKELAIKENESYTLCQTSGRQMVGKCQADGRQLTGSWYTEDSIGKYSIGKYINNTCSKKTETPLQKNDFEGDGTKELKVQNSKPTPISLIDEPPKIDIEALFNKFWKAYPKKQAKAGCRKWFLKPANAVDDKLVELMLKAIEEQKKTKQWLEANGQFIPMPSTWLNQKRWEDEIENKKPVNKYSDPWSEDELKKTNTTETEEVEDIPF